MRRAFTLIELMVVTAVLVLIAGLVLPNVVGMKKAREHRAAYDAVLRLTQKGREAAITTGKPYTLTFTNSGSTLSLQPDTDTTTLSRDGNGGNGSTVSATQSASSLNGSGTNGSASTDQSGTANFPTGATTGQMTLADKSASSGDFTLHFYPDGRSEGGGFEIIDGALTRHFSISPTGVASMADGPLPATTQSSWEAGTYAQRTAS